MKKYFAIILSIAMLLAFAACGKDTTQSSENPAEATSGNTPAVGQTEQNDPSGSAENVQTQPQQADSQNQNGQDNSSAPEGAETDEAELRDAIACKTDGEGHLIVSVKTSAYIKNDSGWLGLCPLGVYLTEEQADDVDSCYAYFDASYVKEWLDGVYTFVLDNVSIDPATYTMVLCDDDDSGSIVGEWIFNKDRSGNIEIGFHESWLRGAGEGRHVKKFDSLEEEAASWFSLNEYSDEWTEFFFDGYYLEEIDPYGYDSYYLFVCPEGDYSTWDEAMEAHVGDYSVIEGKCPYKFSIYHYDIKPGKYTMVLARDGRSDLGVGGGVEMQFGVEKKNATEWTMDFSDVKCPELELKYSAN